mmetsp:Transcript_10945/g.29329  ORF Transcript_10945/g.29329 Transcript_10945/m.29329 type:complete len:601 (-) Transcript_10945:72-1874(-)
MSDTWLLVFTTSVPLAPCERTTPPASSPLAPCKPLGLDGETTASTEQAVPAGKNEARPQGSLKAVPQSSVSSVVQSFQETRLKEKKKAITKVGILSFEIAFVGLCLMGAGLLAKRVVSSQNSVGNIVGWVALILGCCLMACGVCVLSTCPLTGDAKMDLDRASQKLKAFVPRRGFYTLTLVFCAAYSASPPHLTGVLVLFNLFMIFFGGKAHYEEFRPFRPTTGIVFIIMIMGMFGIPSVYLYRGLYASWVPETEKFTWTVAAITMSTSSSILSLMIVLSRLQYERSYNDTSLATVGAPPTLGVYLAFYSITFTYGVAEMILGIWWTLLGNSIGPYNAAYGFVCLVPVLLLWAIGRERLFSISVARFDADNAQGDGAFVAELLTMGVPEVGDVWFVHRNKPNLIYPEMDHMRNWDKGTVTKTLAGAMEVTVLDLPKPTATNKVHPSDAESGPPLSLGLHSHSSSGGRAGGGGPRKRNSIANLLRNVTSRDLHTHVSQSSPEGGVKGGGLTKWDSVADVLKNATHRVVTVKVTTQHTGSEELLTSAWENLRCIDWENIRCVVTVREGCTNLVCGRGGRLPSTFSNFVYFRPSPAIAYSLTL